MGWKVSVNTSSFCEFDRKPLALLNEHGCEVVVNAQRRQLGKAEVIAACRDKDGIIAGTEPLDATVLKECAGLKVISRCGTGMDNVDLQAARERGIAVFNTPDVATTAVAELTMGMMLDLLRKVSLMDRKMRGGKWEKLMGNLLAGKNVGIIGYGRIGRRVGEYVLAFGASVAFCDPFVESNGQVRKMLMTDLLHWADIVTIHVPQSAPLLGGQELDLMKKGSWLVNVSRGGTLDEVALAERLRSGHLAGAALDVYSSEPYNGELLGLENVLLTPHIGSYARESRAQMELESVVNLLKGLVESV